MSVDGLLAHTILQVMLDLALNVFITIITSVQTLMPRFNLVNSILPVVDLGNGVSLYPKQKSC